MATAANGMPVNDSWIAATALALNVPVVTQDDDYVTVPGLDVVRVRTATGAGHRCGDRPRGVRTERCSALGGGLATARVGAVDVAAARPPDPRRSRCE